jgi:hypothetical protein
LLYFDHDDGGTLAFAKPGNESWVRVKTNTKLISAMSCAGRFFGVASDAIMTVDMTGGPPRAVDGGCEDGQADALWVNDGRHGAPGG